MKVSDDTSSKTADAHTHKHDVTITVNGTDVVLPQGKYSGLEIKEAAIAQGADDIQLGFVLSVKHGGSYQILGDTDTVQIHPGLDFLAVTGDDNS